MIKVLVVDDADFLRKRVVSYLKEENYQVSEAASGTVGLTQYVAHQPDVILLDLVLPDIDGISIVKNIRQKDKYVKIIMISGEADRSVIKDAVIAGITDFVVKPFQMDTLKEKIENVLK